MREILFRAKRKDKNIEWDGEWIEGFVAISGGTFIIEDNGLTYGGFKVYEVYSETVEQFTGLTDKFGVKIFEGDILKTETGDKDRPYAYYKITWNDCGFSINNEMPLTAAAVSCDEVVDNIFDNLLNLI